MSVCVLMDYKSHHLLVQEGKYVQTAMSVDLPDCPPTNITRAQVIYKPLYHCVCVLHSDAHISTVYCILIEANPYLFLVMHNCFT